MEKRLGGMETGKLEMFNAVKYEEYCDTLLNSDFHPDETHNMLNFLLHAGYFGKAPEDNPPITLPMTENTIGKFTYYITTTSGRIS